MSTKFISLRVSLKIAILPVVEAWDMLKAYEIAKNMVKTVFEAEGYFSELATFFYYTCT
jgi:hypothetical protein